MELAEEERKKHKGTEASAKIMDDYDAQIRKIEKDIEAYKDTIGILQEKEKKQNDDRQKQLEEQKKKIEELRQAYLDYIDSFSGIVSEYESMQQTFDTTAKAQELFSKYGIEGIGELSTKLEEANVKQLEIGKTLSDLIKKQKAGNELSSEELQLLEAAKEA